MQPSGIANPSASRQASHKTVKPKHRKALKKEGNKSGRNKIRK
jgi:hypothetical protein